MINPFKKSYSSKELNMFRFLARVTLFEKLTYKEMALFVPLLHLRNFKQDDVVFFRNDPSYALYIIKHGRVSLDIDVHERMEPLTVIKSGQAFGDNSLLPKTRRIYNSLVISETADIYVLPQVNLLEVFAQHPEIKAKMLESLAEQYNSYTVNLFKAYKSSFGFFNLGHAYLSETESDNSYK